MNDIWYRNTSWSKTVKDKFFDKLKRARGQASKAQYLRIQAVHLEEVKPNISLELLDILINEYPEPFELPQAYLQKAHCLIALSKPNDAINCFKRSMETESNKTPSTECFLDYTTFIITTERKDLYQEAKKILISNRKNLSFPIDHYRFNTALAIIEWDATNIEQAKSHAELAIEASKLEHSGFSYHPKVGLVKKQNTKIKKLLKKIINV